MKRLLCLVWGLYCLPNTLSVNFADVQSYSSRYLRRVDLLVIGRELRFSGLEEGCFSGVVKAKNENVVFVPLRQALKQVRPHE
jgi:hypothetical protein